MQWIHREAERCLLSGLVSFYAPVFYYISHKCLIENSQLSCSQTLRRWCHVGAPNGLPFLGCVGCRHLHELKIFITNKDASAVILLI
jgi:hypothetical protein